LAAEVQEPGLETFSRRPTAFFVGLVFAVIAGLAAWFGLVEFALWLFAR
jgi:type IV secretory pathway VirB2 component (pilin)